MEVEEEDKGSDQKSDWMAAHARLKNEFTEGENYHISWAVSNHGISIQFLKCSRESENGNRK